MKPNHELYALYEGAVMCRVLKAKVEGARRVALVEFDNGEQALVPAKKLRMKFDLMEGSYE